MTEFSFPTTINNNNEKNKSFVFTKLCSFVFSYPLYFSYLIFFSPYFLKLIFFLSPLLFTIFLLLLSLTTSFIPLNSILNSKDGFFFTVFITFLEKFRWSFDDTMEEFEFCRFIFDVPTIELIEASPVEDGKFRENAVENFCQVEEKTVDQCESSIMKQETGDTNPKKMEEKREQKQDKTVKRRGSEVKKSPKFGSSKVNNGEKFSEAISQTVGEQQCLSRSGSIRKEKEWRGTLACFLFEERHNWSNKKINLDENVNGEEGMDLLWETNETEINKGNLKEEEEENKKKLRRKNNKIEDLMKNDCNDDQSEVSDDYDNGKICCLQALKLSAGKMNLSMGKPSLVKISKVFKGIGWLQSQVRRQGKKGYK